MRMIPAVALVLLVLAAVLFLVANGLLADLAGLDRLLLLAFTGGAVLGGVLVYWSGLRAWVRGGAHPFSLRLLAGLAAIVLWWVLFAGFFWDVVTARLPGSGSGAGGAAVAAVFLALLAVMLWGVYATRRRIWDA